jgi:hypothetical protein
MSKVVITNTTNAPVFVAGRLLTRGASVEVFEYEVPDCLKSQVTTISQDTDDLDISAEESEESEKIGSDDLAEESLIAAAGKKK